jgi:hypothetical protein
MPKQKHPVFSFSISPPNEGKKTYSFRPMLVREEKLLLMAKASEDPTDILGAIKSVVASCSVDLFDVDQLPLYLLEYLFVRLRGASAGDSIPVSYLDPEDGIKYDLNVDVKKIDIVWPEPVDRVVKISEDSGITLRYPLATAYDDKDLLHTEGINAYYAVILRCIDQVYSGEEIHSISEFEAKDVSDFVDMLDSKTFEKLHLFVDSTPHLYCKLEYKNSLGNQRTVELNTLTDFFTLR